ncbi:MAG TPA: AMP-binding protein [Afifellaceae bacterium]|nr:AMP-binding protein [Afifellaceae bacterium]
MSASPPPVAGRIEDALISQAARNPERVAVIAGQQSLSFGDLLAHAGDLASELIALGVAPGDRVTVYLDKTPEAVVACYGIWLAGGTMVPANEGLLAPQVRYILDHSESRVLISTARKLSRFGIEPPEGVAVLDYALPEAPSGQGAVERDFPGGDEPAVILYTSGSTGRPKGILVSHANLIAGARIVSTYLDLRDDERIISIPPFSFDYGLNQLLSAVRIGATLVLQRSHLPADICRTLQEQRITGMPAVPPLWIQLLGDTSPFRKMQFPDLRYMTNTGGVFPVKAVEDYRRLLPHVRIYLMYGLTEAFRSTYLPPNQLDARPGSMGRAIPETEITVIRDGVECAPGEVGELVHRGPTVTLGYWRDPEATARVFRPYPGTEGADAEIAVFSGDQVREDEDGYLYFVGRRDNMIKTQGFRVSPDEIEEMVLESGLVAETAAVGVPDPVAGAAIEVHVVPRDRAAFEESALIGFCRKNMPRHMVPKAVHVHDTLPRTATGKIDRKSLAS